MSALAIAPCQARRLPVIPFLHPIVAQGTSGLEFTRPQDVIQLEPLAAVEEVQRRIHELTEYVRTYGCNGESGPIARIESIGTPGSTRRGLFLFDNRGRIFLQITSMWLGGEGTASRSAEQVLQIVGIPAWLTENLNHTSLILSRPIVVLSREHHEFVGTVDMAVPNRDVELAWDRWFSS